VRFTVKAIWNAAWDVVLVTASFLFALAWRHPVKATIYTLILADDHALAIGLKAMRDSFWYYIVITAAICISFTRVGVKPGIMSTIFFRCVFNISAFVRKF